MNMILEEIESRHAMLLHLINKEVNRITSYLDLSDSKTIPCDEVKARLSMISRLSSKFEDKPYLNESAYIYKEKIKGFKNRSDSECYKWVGPNLGEWGRSFKDLDKLIEELQTKGYKTFSFQFEEE